MTRSPKPVSVAVRLPLSLYEAIDAFAVMEDLNLSEALRRLAVEALQAQGMKQTETTEAGTVEIDDWKRDTLAGDEEQS